MGGGPCLLTGEGVVALEHGALGKRGGAGRLCKATREVPRLVQPRREVARELGEDAPAVELVNVDLVVGHHVVRALSACARVRGRDVLDE